MIESMLNYSDLSETELKLLKNEINNVDEFFVNFEADIESIEHFFTTEVQGLLMLIKMDDDKHFFLYGWSTIYDYIQSYFNMNRDQEGYHDELDFIFTKLVEYLNLIVENREEDNERIMFHFCAEAEGIMINNEEWYNELSQEEQDEWC